MPLLKKTFKGSHSQIKSTSSKHFKTPLNHKHKIKDIIGDSLQESQENKTIDSGIEVFSQATQPCKSSTPRSDNEVYDNNNVNRKGKKDKKDRKDQRLKRKLSMSTDESLSQEELNRDKIKAAYVEFMNNSFAKENKDEKQIITYSSSDDSLDDVNEIVSQSKVFIPNSKENSKYDSIMETLSQTTPTPSYKSFSSRGNEEVDKNNKNVHRKGTKEKNSRKDQSLKRKLSLSTDESLSQEQLNRNEIKTAYVQFMNKSLTKENKKRNFIIYSSSEDFLDEVVETVSQNKICKSHSKEKVFSKRANNKPLQNLMIYSSEDPTDKPLEKMSVNKKTNAGCTIVQKDKSAKKKSVLQNEPKKTTKEKLTTKKKPVNKNDEKVYQEIEHSDNQFQQLTVEEKMDRIYEARNVGLYVYCDMCNKARYLADVVDPLDTPNKWYCYMNPDKNHNKCSDPEEVEEDEEFLIHNLYNAGSIVYARMEGYPWWPAMVEDDPDLEEYFWLEKSMEPTYYHVTFFDSAEVSRAWIKTSMLQAFKKNLHNPEFQKVTNRKYKARLSAAYKQAVDAIDKPLIDRLKTYGFFKRYNKPTKRTNRRKQDSQKNKGQNKKQKSTLLLDENSNMSEILGDVNLLDLSFNFLD